MNQRKLVVFVDDNIVGNPKFAKELFRALVPYKIKWLAQVSVTIARDDELLKLAAASGCQALLIGFETLSPANLVAVGKRVNVVDESEAKVYYTIPMPPYSVSEETVGVLPFVHHG